ncbi:hypothetical protein, partial [Serratia marcescens]|uniref:hypothetical protein n=1 Tax=Serratia marcescens TaxID=615 RepID=UPI001C376C92
YGMRHFTPTAMGIILGLLQGNATLATGIKTVYLSQNPQLIRTTKKCTHSDKWMFSNASAFIQSHEIVDRWCKCSSTPIRRLRVQSTMPI